MRDPDRYLLTFTEPTDEPPTTAEPGDALARKPFRIDDLLAAVGRVLERTHV